MFPKRQTEGSVICTSCGVLVGVTDATCYNCGRRNPGLWGYAPWFRRLGQDLGFVPLVMGGTITLYVIALLLSGSSIQTLLAPEHRRCWCCSAPAARCRCSASIAGGRVLTAGWLHAGVLHILFNVLWIRQLGPAVADLYGPGRMVILYTVSGVVGFTFSSVAGQYLGGLPIIGGGTADSVGASAPIFGLLGALVYYGRRTGIAARRRRRPPVRADDGHLRPDLAGGGQPGAPRRVRRRLPGRDCCWTRSSPSGSTTWSAPRPACS